MLFGVQGILQLGAVSLLHAVIDSLIERQRSHDNFLWLNLIVELLDAGDDFLDLGVAKFEGFDNFLFGNFERAGLDHHDPVGSASDDDIELAGFLLGNGRIGDELAVKKAHANGSDGIIERQVRAISGGGSSGDGDDIGVVVAISGEHHGDNLGFIAPGIGEERAHGAVNQPGNKDLFFGGAAFAFEKSAWDFAGGVSIFAVVDGQGEKVAIVRLVGHAGADEQDSVAIAGGHGAIGLLGDFPG